MTAGTWADLLEAFTPYAQLTGWRFSLGDFMRIDDPKVSDELRAAQEQALPLALDFGDQLRALSKLPPSEANESPLLQEFELAARKVAREAVYKTMVATCKALSVSDARATFPAAASDEDPESCAYQDLSQPFEVIARRLQNYATALEAVPGAKEERDCRCAQAASASLSALPPPPPPPPAPPCISVYLVCTVGLGCTHAPAG